MDTRNINIITLAYMGDAVYEVYIRKALIEKNIALVDDLQKVAVNYVSAQSQSKILNFLKTIAFWGVFFLIIIVSLFDVPLTDGLIKDAAATASPINLLA